MRTIEYIIFSAIEENTSTIVGHEHGPDYSRGKTRERPFLVRTRTARVRAGCNVEGEDTRSLHGRHERREDAGDVWV